MKKVFKILIILLLLGIFTGAIVNVLINHKKEKEKEKNNKNDIPNETYKVKRKNNKYSVSNTEGKLLNKNIQNIFYNGKIVYIYLSDEENKENATLLKYDLKKEKTKVLYEENKEILGQIEKLGKNYVINDNIYDNNFNKIEELTYNKTDEQLFPNLKEKIVKYDKKLVKINLETKEENVIIENEDNKKYDTFLITDNSKVLILKMQEDNKTKLIAIKNGKKSDFSIEYKEKNTYKLLTNKYLLEIEENEENNTYTVYDLDTNNVVYKEKTKDKYLFYKTKILLKNENGELVLDDYITQEENYIGKIELDVESFIVPDDNYTLLVHYKESNNVFYIYYL